MDGQNIVTKPDQARLMTAFETLLTFDDDYQLKTDGLAESVEADNPTQYTIKIRKGIDVPERQAAYRRRRHLLAAAHRHPGQRPHRVRRDGDDGHQEHQEGRQVHGPAAAAERRTRRSRRRWPATPSAWSRSATRRTRATRPRRSAPAAYKLKSFTPGQESVHERNPNYWRGDGSPWFDTVTITDFNDSTAQLNALKGGQIDAMTDVPAGQVDAVQASGVGILNSQTGGWIPLCMAIDMPPFDDPQVRQAFRLIIDRKQMLEQVGNGLRPDRQRPVRAVRRGLRHVTAPARAGHRAGQVAAQVGGQGGPQRRPAHHQRRRPAWSSSPASSPRRPRTPGSTSRSRTTRTTTATPTSSWRSRSTSGAPAATSTRCSRARCRTRRTTRPTGRPSPATGSDFGHLYKQALAETDDNKRIDIQHQMQKYEYDIGGYIIPYFNALIDGYGDEGQGASRRARAR